MSLPMAGIGMCQERHHPSMPHRGMFEVGLDARESFANPYTDVSLQVTFTRPNDSRVTVDAFFDGGTTWRAQAYCDMQGGWTWDSAARTAGLGSKSGAFTVALPREWASCASARATLASSATTMAVLAIGSC